MTDRTTRESTSSASQSKRSGSIQIPLRRDRGSIVLKAGSVGSGSQDHGKLTEIAPAAADSHVLIDMASPNFRTQQPEQIINSLRANYLNSSIKQSVSSDEASNSTVKARSPSIATDNDRGLAAAGGDMTRDIFKLTKPSGIHKTMSLEDLRAAKDQCRRQSTASCLNVPGGFRREFIVQRKRQQQHQAPATSDYRMLNRDSSEDLENDNEKIPFLTRNFLEFLYLYGHFAGESFEDDFLPDSLEQTDERAPLLRSTTTTRDLKSSKGKTSTSKSFFLLLKSFIGTGVLFLPSAFNDGGLLFSIIMLLLFGMCSFWCYYILAVSKNAAQVSSFGDIGLKLYGKWMKFTILFSLVITQVGFSAAYIIFTAENLNSFIRNIFRVKSVDPLYLMLGQLCIFVPLSFVRNISKLSFPSLVANFFIMAGLIIVVFFSSKHLLVDLSSKPEVGVISIFNSDRWTIFVGTAIFAFEGIGLIIPIQDSMINPSKFPLVLGLVILCATILFVIIGTIGYLAYGNNIQTFILLNLPQSNIFVNLIQLFYSLAILLSTPLQMFPAIKIIENKVFPKFTRIYVESDDISSSHFELRANSGKLDWQVKWLKNLVRTVIVSFIILLAYIGSDKLDKVVSIIGSLACIPLVYMYPPMLHLQTLHNAPSHGWDKLVILDYVLIVFGGLSMLYTSYQSAFGV